MPVVTVERLFSSVKRIKTGLRSRMTTDRLSALSLLTFERDLSKKLEKDYILLKFKRMKNRRLLWLCKNWSFLNVDIHYGEALSIIYYASAMLDIVGTIIISVLCFMITKFCSMNNEHFAY